MQARVIPLFGAQARDVAAGDAQEGAPVPKPQPLTLQGAWAIFRRENFEANLKPRTAESYRWAMARAIREMPPRPTTADIEHWLRVTLVQGGKVKPASANGLLRSVRAVVVAASRHVHEVELRDAFDLATPLRCGPRRVRVPPRNALAVLSRYCDDDAERLWLWLCAVGGLRLSEVRGLEPGDRDPVSGLVRIERAFSRGYEGPRKNDTARTGATHTVRLTTLADRWWRWTEDNRHTLKPRRGPRHRQYERKLFPWSKTRIDDFAAKLRSRLGPVERHMYMPPGDAWHHLRHLAATMTAERSGSIVEVMRVLGDRSATQALTYMGQVRGGTEHVSTEALERAMLDGRQYELATRAKSKKSAAEGAVNALGSGAQSEMFPQTKRPDSQQSKVPSLDSQES